MSDSLCWHSCEEIEPVVGVCLIVKISDGNYRVCVHHGDGMYWDLFACRYLEGISERPTHWICCSRVADFLDDTESLKVMRNDVSLQGE